MKTLIVFILAAAASFVLAQTPAPVDPAADEPKAAAQTPKPRLTPEGREAYHVALENIMAADARASALRLEIREKLQPALAAEWQKLVATCGGDPKPDEKGVLQCAPAPVNNSPGGGK
jgi:hypothetical protein